MTDFYDEIRDRADISGPSDLSCYIEQIGSVNTKSDFTRDTVYDFFLGDDDTSAFDRLASGEFGGSVVVQGDTVSTATVRVGRLDVTRGVTDTLLVEARLEELLESMGVPDGVEIDLGDFEQGVPHLRYQPDGHQHLSVDEFGQFMVDAVREIRDNFDGLQEIADGEKFGPL